MDYHRFKSAINRYLLRYAGFEKRPVFFDIARTYPQLDALRQAYPAIRKELATLMEQRVAMPDYHVVNKPATEISASTPGHWKVFMLELLGHKPQANRARCPQTCAALARVPGVLQAFFSVLEPGKSIPEHDGPYVGYLRYHLGLQVPDDEPPFIVVAGQPYVWKEGEDVLFDDSWPHAVVNKSSKPRVVLIVDVPRPMPLWPRLVNLLVLWGVAAPLYGKKVVQKTVAYTGDLI